MGSGYRLHQLVELFASGIAIGCHDNFRTSGHGSDRLTDERELHRSDCSGRTQIADAAIGEQLVVAEGVDHGFDDDEARVVGSGCAHPKGLSTTGCKPGEAFVLHFVSNHPTRVFRIEVWKQHVPASIGAIATAEAR